MAHSRARIAFIALALAAACGTALFIALGRVAAPRRGPPPGDAPPTAGDTLGEADERVPPPEPGNPPPPEPARAKPPVPPAGPLDESPAGADTRGSAAKPEATPTLPMKPVEAKAKKAVKPLPVKVADTLAGHDRNLAERPFDAIAAGDFQIGALWKPGADDRVDKALGELALALRSRSLPESLFTGEAAKTAIFMLGPGLAELPETLEVRIGQPQLMPGNQAAVRIRLVETDVAGRPSLGRSAEGLAVLSRAESGATLVEHLEIDLSTFETPSAREEPWDPYSTGGPGR